MLSDVNWHPMALFVTFWLFFGNGRYKAFPDQLVYVGELIVNFPADCIIRQFAGGTVTLQGSRTYLEHLHNILIVQQLFSVNSSMLILTCAYRLHKDVEPLHDSVHPRREFHSIDIHNRYFWFNTTKLTHEKIIFCQVLPIDKEDFFCKSFYKMAGYRGLGLSVHCNE